MKRFSKSLVMSSVFVFACGCTTIVEPLPVEAPQVQKTTVEEVLHVREDEVRKNITFAHLTARRVFDMMLAEKLKTSKTVLKRVDSPESLHITYRQLSEAAVFNDTVGLFDTDADSVISCNEAHAIYTELLAKNKETAKELRPMEFLGVGKTYADADKDSLKQAEEAREKISMEFSYPVESVFFKKLGKYHSSSDRNQVQSGMAYQYYYSLERHLAFEASKETTENKPKRSVGF